MPGKELQMKVVVAIDSLKGSLTSLEAGAAVRDGIRKADPDAEVVIRPVADGGEGTVEALVLGMNGRPETVMVTGPLGKPVSCIYGILEKQRTAVIEMSGAAGITLVSARERNPLDTTTYGVGEVIRDAVNKGCRSFIIGIGGSATNDGGVGMLQALGWSFLDKDGRQVPFGARGVGLIERIEDDRVLPELKKCTFKIACDVTNVLCGEQGCSAVFGPQKGADAGMVLQMDRYLAGYAQLTKEKYPNADASFPGSGAAGGMGFAFRSYLNGSLESGVKIILDETGLEKDIMNADVVVTGEGRLDSQTTMGKAPAGVAELAKKYGKPVIAFAGCVTEDAGACNDAGIDAFFPILRSAVTAEEAMNRDTAINNMMKTAEQVFRLLKVKV